ncbi:MAG: hypothetical protein K6A81_01450 [Clostridiales bacterium]|nr:hypothetical protein [Clostridiales bacterium]
MKALKVIATTVMTVAILGAQVLAAAPSPAAGDGPKVKSAKLADGTDITANIVVTRLGTTSPYAEVNAYLKSAKDDIDAASNKPANLKGEDGKTLEAKLQEVLDKEAKGTKASDLAFAEIFDVVYVVNGKVTPLPSTATIEFEYTAPDGSVLIFIHQTKAGAWKFEATTATATVSSLSPFAFVTAKKAAAADSKSGDDGKTSPQTGEYVTKSVLAGAAVLAVLGMVCVVRAKKSSKAN